MTNYLLAVLKSAVYSLFGKTTIQINKSLCTCAFMLVVLNMTYAQDYSLSGIIQGNNNQPISGVTVKVEQQTVFTDNSGFYKINNIKNRTVDIVAQAVGFHEFKHRILLKDLNNSLDIKLISQDVKIDEVVVTGLTKSQ